MIKPLNINVLTGVFLLASISGWGAETKPGVAITGDALGKNDPLVKRVSSVLGYLTAQVEVQREVLVGTPSLYASGNGSTLQKAIVIHAPDAKAGMKAENAWLEEKYPGHWLLRILTLEPIS